MLARICRAYHFRTMTAKISNPDLDDGNPGRATELGNACVRENNRLGLAYGQWRRVWNVKGHKTWGLKAHLSKIRPGVPVHISGVPVHICHCPLLLKLYRYTFKLYRYTLATACFRASCIGTTLGCTGTLLPN